MNQDNEDSLGAGAPFLLPPALDESDAGLSPTVEETPVGPIKPVELPEPMDLEAIEKSCRDLNLTTVDLKKLGQIQGLGRYLKQLGAVAVGRTYLLMALDRISDAVDSCVVFDALSTDPEIKVSILKVRASLLASQISGASRMIQSAKVDASDSTQSIRRSSSFGPRQIVVPQQSQQVIIVSDKVKGQNEPAILPLQPDSEGRLATDTGELGNG